MDIREIARRAKVSTATVSRAINRVPTVDPQLAKRVWKVVDELGYYPNTQARALVSGKSRIFGLVVSEITNPFFPEIVQTFEELAVQNNYEILLTSTVHDSTRMKSSVRRMIERRVDGVAILTFGMEESLLNDLRLRKVMAHGRIRHGPREHAMLEIGKTRGRDADRQARQSRGGT